MTKGINLKSLEIVLRSRPSGWPTSDNFGIRTVEVDGPGDDELLVQLLWLSVDPYMRGRMNDARSYVPPFALGEALVGGAVGKVIESRHDGFASGDIVVGNFRWREFDTLQAGMVRKVDPDIAPLSVHLGVLGMPGLTAFVGMRRIGGIVPSDTVFVSGAAGAVGSVASQIAKLSGAKVIGSAGSSAKVENLLAKGLDYAFNYKEKSPNEALREYAPSGISLYFDNVGGEHLRSAINHMENFGRVVMCGAISQYNLDHQPEGPNNLMLVVAKRLTLRGFIVSDHNDLLDPFLSEAVGWLRHGKLKYDETVRTGIENAPGALVDMMKGENIGKMVVKVS